MAGGTKTGGGAGTATSNTGNPNWASGTTTGNGVAAATTPAPATTTNALVTQPTTTQPATTGGAPTGMTTGSTTAAGTTAAPNSGGTSSPAIGGEWWKPGTEAYNNMNNLLATTPMGSIVQILQSNGMTDMANTVMQNLANTTGSNSWMNTAADLFQNLTSGQAGQNFQNVYNTAGQPGVAQTNLGGMASGSMIGNNPYTAQIAQTAEQEAADKVNQMFGAGGRYGSGMNQGTVAQAVADINNQFLGGQYNLDTQNMMNANQLISGEQLGRLGIQNNAAQGYGGLATAGAQGLGGLGQSAMNNWMNAQMGAANLSNQGMQNMFSAMGLLPTVQNNKMFDAQQQAAVGREVDSATQAQINDLINQWNQGDMQGWAALGGLLSAATGSAGNWGSASGTTKQSSSPGWGGVLGTILSFL